MGILFCSISSIRWWCYLFHTSAAVFECKTHDSRSEEEQFPTMAQEKEEHPVLTKSRLEDIARRWRETPALTL